MSEAAKAIVGEWIEQFRFPELVERDAEYPEVSHLPEIPAVLGPRRSGKTFFFFQIILIEKRGVATDRILFVDFEDYRMSKPTQPAPSSTSPFMASSKAAHQTPLTTNPPISGICLPPKPAELSLFSITPLKAGKANEQDHNLQSAITTNKNAAGFSLATLHLLLMIRHSLSCAVSRPY